MTDPAKFDVTAGAWAQPMRTTHFKGGGEKRVDPTPGAS